MPVVKTEAAPTTSMAMALRDVRQAFGVERHICGSIVRRAATSGQGRRDIPCPVATGNVLVTGKIARLYEHCQ